MNGRISNQDLADRVGLSPSPCLRRVRALESAGIIEGYGARVNLSRFGLPVTVFVRLKLSTHGNTRDVERRLSSSPLVQECYLMAGDHDFLLKVAVASIDGYEQFLRQHLNGIPEITSIESNFVMATIKTGSSLPDL